MLHADWQPYILRMRRPSTTSRETMTEKLTYFVTVSSDAVPGVVGRGEAALFMGLSEESPIADAAGRRYTRQYEARLDDWCKHINELVEFADGKYVLSSEVNYSSVRFGFETALSALENRDAKRPFNLRDDWSIEINGLVWMGTREFMLEEARKKLEQGFKCLKFKIGGIKFEEELEIIAGVRRAFPKEVLEIRLDANGGFTSENALERLERLSAFDIHSLEQPIKPKQWAQMAEICSKSPIPIALDEELIGMTDDATKHRMLAEIRPAYVILKPSLCGGFGEADKWIEMAEEAQIGWWATSALESDVGLNAIARWVSLKPITMPQGLGTGQLYTNNLDVGLQLRGNRLEHKDIANNRLVD